MGQLEMSIYLKKLRIRYFKTDRKGKSLILEEFCATSGLHRKHVIRSFYSGWTENAAVRNKGAAGVRR